MTHKNKTLTALLAVLFGWLGAHRFYLFGRHDRWGWLHLISLPISLLIWALAPDQPLLFSGSLLAASVLIAQLEALVIGLTPDEIWDAKHNATSDYPSDSGWGVILLMIVAMAGGSAGLISAMARTFDLLYTGGAYG